MSARAGTLDLMEFLAAAVLMPAQRVAEWRKDAPAVFPKTAEVLDAHGWTPATAERCITAITGAFTTMPLLMAANATLVAASHLTNIIRTVTPDEAVLCAQAGLNSDEVSALLARGPLDRATLTTMVALRG